MKKKNKKEIIFRKMGIKDIEAVLKVENRSFSTPWSEVMFLDDLNNPDAVYFVARVDGVVVGYAGLWIVLDEAHITNIAVDPSFRGQHIAFGLMEKIIELSRERALTSLTLEVRRGNLPAISLYERFGFIVEGRRKGYYRDNYEDALIMWCYL